MHKNNSCLECGEKKLFSFPICAKTLAIGNHNTYMMTDENKKLFLMMIIEINLASVENPSQCLQCHLH